MAATHTPPDIWLKAAHQAIQNALAEDVGAGDHSTLAVIDTSATGKAQLLVKQPGILAGIEAARLVFGQVDKNLRLKTYKKDGDPVQSGDIAFVLSGPVRSILTAERLALNILQRMSGIASQTHKLMQLIADTPTQLLDTRKTTPNFRVFEKWAVRIGGGHNHRFGLYDMIMLKDNHIDFAGGITPAVKKVRKYLADRHLNLRIEVETRTLDEVAEALAAGVEVIMLDNMSLADMRQAVTLIDHTCQTEASGNITAENIRAVARTGVDYISMGALTYGYPSLDMSLKAVF